MASTQSRKSIFTPEEKALIRPFKTAYLEATSPAGRKDIAITSILPSLISKWEAELVPGATLNRKEACKVRYSTIITFNALIFCQSVLQWIRNNWRLGDSPTKAKLVVKRTDVVWMLHRDLVFQELAKLMKKPVAEVEKSDWFKHRMTAIGNVISNMSDDERRAVDEKKEFMSANGFPEEERPKYGYRPYL